MIICFEEKYDNRYVKGEDLFSILSYVLKKRIEDEFAPGVSNWYYDETDLAKKCLDEGRAIQFMRSRQNYEYENWYELKIEEVN